MWKSYAELATTADYAKFHTDPRVSIFAYTDPSSTSSAIFHGGGDDSEHQDTTAQPMEIGGQVDTTPWVFGLDIPTRKIMSGAAVSANATSQLRTVALRTPLVTCWPAKASIATKSGNLVTADAEPGDLSDARAAALAGAMGGQPDSEYRLVFLARVGPMGSERADAAA